MIVAHVLLFLGGCFFIFKAHLTSGFSFYITCFYRLVELHSLTALFFAHFILRKLSHLMPHRTVFLPPPTSETETEKK